jgi:Uma2 family endonuclease
LIDGVIVMMTGPTRRHEKIVVRIGGRLSLAMEKRGCQSFQGGTHVQRNAAPKALDKPKPDIVIRCGPDDSESELLNFIDDPVVVIEVLSPPTMDYDRGPKLIFYKSLPTLQHIVIVYQDEMRMEHYKRADEDWVMEVLTKPKDILDLSAVAFKLAIAEAYAGVEGRLG